MRFRFSPYRQLLPVCISGLWLLLPIYISPGESPPVPTAVDTPPAQIAPGFARADFLPISRIEPLLHEPPLLWRQLLELQRAAVASAADTALSSSGVEQSFPETPASATSTVPAELAVMLQLPPPPPPLTPAFTGAISDGRVWINDATVEELMRGLDIDYERAAALERYRRIYGPFENYDALKQVHGISEARFAQLREKIVIAPPATAAHLGSASASEPRP